jgi:hypothetical protein
MEILAEEAQAEVVRATMGRLAIQEAALHKKPTKRWAAHVHAKVATALLEIQEAALRKKPTKRWVVHVHAKVATALLEIQEAALLKKLTK